MKGHAAGVVDIVGLAADIVGLPPTRVAPSPASGYTTRCAATCSGAPTSTPARCRRVLSKQRELSQTAAPADTDLMRCEDELLDLFADVSSLYRPRGEIDPEMALLTGSTQEYLLSYLQWLDADRAGLPDFDRRGWSRRCCATVCRD